MESKAAPNKNYDHTINKRVDRHRKALVESGGSRVENRFNADETARLDALIASGQAKSRSEAVKIAVAMLPVPKMIKKT